MAKNRKNGTRVETGQPAKHRHGFQPGRSGNPDSHGGVKKTPEQLDALMEIRGMAPLAVSKLQSMLDSDKTPAAVKVKICEIILDRTYGKPEASVRVTNVQETVSRSREYINALICDARILTGGLGGSDPGLPGSGDSRMPAGREAIVMDLPGKEALKVVETVDVMKGGAAG